MTRPGFETKARTLRYRALGEASFRHGIQTLLVAHHADDQAETVLSRLAINHRGVGLTPLRASAQIPECRGLYGIYESGDFVSEGEELAEEKYVGGPEEGGLSIKRPLLEFPKSRLVATCEAAGVKWIEDESNGDPSLTIRNTIRHLLDKELLPAALSRESLLRFSENIRRNIEEQQAIADRIYLASRVHIDLRSGSISVEVPPIKQVVGSKQWWLFPEGWKMRLVGRFLRHVAQYTTAKENIVAELLGPVVSNMFRQDLVGRDRKDDGLLLGPLRERIGVGGALFEQTRSAAPTQETWTTSLRVSRTPFRATEVPPSMYFPPKTLQSSPEEATPGSSCHTMKLWDGRFWISISNNSSEVVSVVALTEKLLTNFKKSLSKDRVKLLESLLSDAAPNKIRWTLPAIVVPLPLNERSKKGQPGNSSSRPRHQAIKTDGDTADKGLQVNDSCGPQPCARQDGDTFTKKERDKAAIVALPTLGIVLEEWEKKLSWDIRFKKIELPGLRKVDKWPDSIRDYPHILVKEPGLSVKPVIRGRRGRPTTEQMSRKHEALNHLY